MTRSPAGISRWFVGAGALVAASALLIGCGSKDETTGAGDTKAVESSVAGTVIANTTAQESGGAIATVNSISGNPATETAAAPTDLAGAVCGKSEYIDDNYHFMAGDHAFLQICAAGQPGDGVLLSYVADSTEVMAVPVNFFESKDFTLDCGFTDLVPVCLIQAENKAADGFQGRLFKLTKDGVIEPVLPESENQVITSTVRMAFTPLAAADSSLNDAMLLVQGWEFTELAKANQPAPVGYRTAKVDPDSVSFAGCTQAYTSSYPKVPTVINTGMCDATATVIEN